MSGLSNHASFQLGGLGDPDVSQPNEVIVGLYGVPGSGKSTLLNKLKLELGRAAGFEFYEGSEVIASLVVGGLDAFQNLEENEKNYWRAQAIDKIKQECLDQGKTGVVTGHFMTWAEGEDNGHPILTPNDFKIYTHILYLAVPPEELSRRWSNDTNRERPDVSVQHLLRWQETEIAGLRQCCSLHGIFFTDLASDTAIVANVAILLRDFRRHTETYNLSQAGRALQKAISSTDKRFRAAWIIDADKTLTAEDTGALFWNLARGPHSESPLKKIFGSPWAYSYKAFRQATLQYEEFDKQRYDDLCHNVASKIEMHPEFLCLLQLAAEVQIFLVVITCGPRLVWEKVIHREGLSGVVNVIGGGRLADGYVVTPEVKGSLCSQLRETYRMFVAAFGDSPVDIPMLKKANRAIVVVGSEGQRSHSMDEALAEAIGDGLQAFQTLLPRGAPPRLEPAQLPLADLKDANFLETLIPGGLQPIDLKVVHATDSAASKLLRTPMRNDDIFGVNLRHAHEKAGQYLALGLLADAIGLEEYPIPHVQDYQTDGHRLFHERDTLIVALMRGGEPMALGISDVFPLASFLHATNPDDIQHVHIQDKTTIILVDSVVNTGQTILRFVQHIRKIHATIQIVIAAGVIQSRCITEGDIARSLSQFKRLKICALRLSQNQFTGSGATDTGNRLFNTTYL